MLTCFVHVKLGWECNWDSLRQTYTEKYADLINSDWMFYFQKISQVYYIY